MTTPQNGYVPAQYLAPITRAKTPGLVAEKNTAAAVDALLAAVPGSYVVGLAAAYWSRAVDEDLRKNPAKYDIVDTNLSPVGQSPHGLGTRINIHGVTAAQAAAHGFKPYNSYTWDFTGAKSWDQAPLEPVAQVAQEVIAGKWGNGDDRKTRLTAAGYDYNAVQAQVNADLAAQKPAAKSVDELAHEVIAGQWGNGADRKNRLIAAGYNYAAVQARVNQLV